MLCSQACLSHLPKHSTQTPHTCVPHTSRKFTLNADTRKGFTEKIQNISEVSSILDVCMWLFANHWPQVSLFLSKILMFSVNLILIRKKKKNARKPPQNWLLIIDSHATLKNIYLPKWEKYNFPSSPLTLTEQDGKQTFEQGRGPGSGLPHAEAGVQGKSPSILFHQQVFLRPTVRDNAPLSGN